MSVKPPLEQIKEHRRETRELIKQADAGLAWLDEAERGIQEQRAALVAARARLVAMDNELADRIFRLNVPWLFGE